MADNPPQSCARCHNLPNEADAPARLGLKGAYHRQCISCHERHMQPAPAPTECDSCHHPWTPDHSRLVQLPVRPSPQEVTRSCLSCHTRVGEDLLATAHWNWKGQSPTLAGYQHRTDVSLQLMVNNYCIAIGSNPQACATCHIGYGWVDEAFDFTDPSTIDCLVCHDTTGRYTKDPARGGRPPEELDLVAIAEKVGRPNRANCGSCHFEVCTGPNEKHGDLGPELAEPTPDTDVHMGLVGFNCQDCHRTSDHRIAGQSLSYPPSEGRVACLDCHGEATHALVERLGAHLDAHVRHVACESCHIPSYARITPTVVLWDWSTAGSPRPDDLPQDALHLHSPAEGTRVLGKDLVPAYQWYDGTHERYAVGQEIDPTIETQLNPPMGARADPRSRIAPFKILAGKQPYDAERKVLALPKWLPGLGEAVAWEESLRQGMASAKQEFSGKWGFAPTRMFLGIEHEVQAADKALGCADCHRSELLGCNRCHPGAQGLDPTALVQARYPGRTGRMDFSALGYPGDPAEVGGRLRTIPLPPVPPPVPAR
jgi:octaheme c-type cytochrome (tetrathionate reductase family)